MRRILVGGSAANPPHLGHLMMLDKLLSCREFDKIIWIPSGKRNDKDIDVDPTHRIAMTELSIPKKWRLFPGARNQHHARLVIDYSEIYGESIKAYDRLSQQWTDFSLDATYWFTGTDCDISTWYRGEDLLKRRAVVFIDRENHSLPEGIEYIRPEWMPLIKLPDISSSDIRNRVYYNMPFEHLVPKKVARYIKETGLYSQKGVK